MRARIGIDAHCIGLRKTGNETYTYNLVKHLSLLESDSFEFFIYLIEQKGAINGKIADPAFTYRMIRPGTPILRNSIAFPFEARRRKLDLFHTLYYLPPALSCRTVLTIHDISYERFPEFFTKSENLRNRLLIPNSARRADRIITISEASKRDLVEFYRLDPARITVTYLAASDAFRPLEKQLVKKVLEERYGISQPFLLYVGALQPRKNISRLVAAFSHLCSGKSGFSHKLVIVGPKAWLYQDVFRTLEQHHMEENVIFTGYVPDDDLPYFYNAATLFVYPSIFEGFGLPVLEAMACGTPTITSRGSALEEVAGDAGILVDPYDESQIADSIEQLLKNAELRQELREKGLRRSSEFSYFKMAQQTQAVYREVLGM